jgi:hypothetical protein
MGISWHVGLAGGFIEEERGSKAAEMPQAGGCAEGMA